MIDLKEWEAFQAFRKEKMEIALSKLREKTIEEMGATFLFCGLPPLEKIPNTIEAFLDWKLKKLNHECDYEAC